MLNHEKDVALKALGDAIDTASQNPPKKTPIEGILCWDASAAEWRDFEHKELIEGDIWKYKYPAQLLVDPDLRVFKVVWAKHITEVPAVVPSTLRGEKIKTRPVNFYAFDHIVVPDPSIGLTPMEIVDIVVPDPSVGLTPMEIVDEGT